MAGLIYPIAASLVAIGVVVWLWRDVMSRKPGNETMQSISNLIQKGAAAFLKREYITVGYVLAVVVVFFVIAGIVRPQAGVNWQTALAFIVGAGASMLAGVVGMTIATRANCRTAEAARTGGTSAALSVAISGGAVMGMAVAGFALLGLCIVWIVFQGQTSIVNGYAMGASLLALFGRSGGGIYTKGADMGADLVGKVESGLPEDDPRNPAVIADNVGDNVGDVAGLGADLCESYVESIIAATAIIGLLVAAKTIPEAVGTKFIMLPFLIASLGIAGSILGVLYVKFLGRTNPQGSLMMGTYIAGAFTIVTTFVLVGGMHFTQEEILQVGGAGIASGMAPALACVLGIICGMGVGFISEYYTSAKYKPVRRLANDSQTGAAITVTGGLSIGMSSTAAPVILMGIAIWLAYWLCGGYGVALAAFGMLATTGMVVAVDSYGPIADNAGGIAEMAALPKEVRKVTDHLDAVGNTTAAIGKGFAIGSAALAAFGLLLAYQAAANLPTINLLHPSVLVGLLIGGMVPYLFSAWLFRAVGGAAYAMIEEVRRQFREIKGLREGEPGVLPDSATCVDISTRGALIGMMKPGIMAILIPVIVGFISKEMLGGVLVGALVTGVMLGIQSANSGGAMDNAKKYIEEGNFGGKNSDAHKAAVIGDTVGDPLKDTVGPSINILIKLMAVISLVLAPLFG